MAITPRASMHKLAPSAHMRGGPGISNQTEASPNSHGISGCQSRRFGVVHNSIVAQQRFMRTSSEGFRKREGFGDLQRIKNRKKWRIDTKQYLRVNRQRWSSLHKHVYYHSKYHHGRGKPRKQCGDPESTYEIVAQPGCFGPGERRPCRFLSSAHSRWKAA